MTRDTLLFFQELLGRVQIPANAPDFDELVARVQLARKDLAEALEEEA